MNAKYVTLAILIVVWMVLLLPPAISWAGPVQVLLEPSAVEPGAAQTESRAALIVQFGDGGYVTRCISFAEDSIAGLELLARSGLEADLWGGAVCRIQDEGCDYPVQPCFCQCKGSSCQYWSYWHWRDGTVSPSVGRGAWAYSQIGSGDYQVHNGDVDAWLWGNAQTPPVARSFAEICGPSAAATAALSETLSHPEDGETRVPSVQQSGQGVSLGQYVVFLIMALALVASVWFRSRHGG